MLVGRWGRRKWRGVCSEKVCGRADQRWGDCGGQQLRRKDGAGCREGPAGRGEGVDWRSARMCWTSIICIARLSRSRRHTVLLRLLSPRRGDGSSVWLGPAGLQMAHPHTHSLLETTRTAHNTSMAQEAKTHEMRLELTASPAVPTARDPAPAAPPPPAPAAPLAQASVINSPKEVGRRRLPGLRRLVAGVRPQLITALPAGLRLLDRRRRPPLQRQSAQALHAGHPAGVSGRSCLTRATLQMRTGLWSEVGAFHTSSFLYLQTRVHNSLALHAGCTWGWASARARSPEARSLWRCGRSSPASSTSST